MIVSPLEIPDAIVGTAVDCLLEEGSIIPHHGY